MLNMTHRGKHCRLYDVIQKGGKPLLCDVELDSERQTLSSFMMFSMTQRQTLPSCVKLRLTQRQTLSRCTTTLVMSQRDKLVWCAKYETERQTLLFCVMLNTTARQISMEVCEEMIRGMPKCSKHEWRRKKRKNVDGLLSGFRVLSGGLMFGLLAFVLPAKYIQRKFFTHFLSRQEHFSPSNTVSPRSFSLFMIRL